MKLLLVWLNLHDLFVLFSVCCGNVQFSLENVKRYQWPFVVSAQCNLFFQKRKQKNKTKPFSYFCPGSAKVVKIESTGIKYTLEKQIVLVLPWRYTSKCWFVLHFWHSMCIWFPLSIPLLLSQVFFWPFGFLLACKPNILSLFPSISWRYPLNWRICTFGLWVVFRHV